MLFAIRDFIILFSVKLFYAGNTYRYSDVVSDNDLNFCISVVVFGQLKYLIIFFNINLRVNYGLADFTESFEIRTRALSVLVLLIASLQIFGISLKLFWQRYN
jgi:hypothetical protein